MWPPVSLEHEGADWHVRDSITPVRHQQLDRPASPPAPAHSSPSVTFALGEHKLRATAAVMAANEPSGTFATHRGWPLYDRTTLAFG